MTMEGFMHSARHTKPAQKVHSFWSLETKFENIKMGTSFNIFTREKKGKSEPTYWEWGETIA